MSASATRARLLSPTSTAVSDTSTYSARPVWAWLWPWQTDKQQSRRLERQYVQYTAHTAARRFAFALCLLLYALLLAAWSAYNLLNGSEAGELRRWLWVASGTLCGLLALGLAWLVARSSLYQHWWWALSNGVGVLVVAYVAAMSSLSQRSSQVCGVAMLGTVTLYTLVPLPLPNTVLLAALLAVLEAATQLARASALGPSELQLAGCHVVLLVGANMLGVYHATYAHHFRWQSFIRIRELIRTQSRMRLETDISERFLLSLLPRAVQQRIDVIAQGRRAWNSFRQLAVERVDSVSVLFADIVGFTVLSSQMEAPALVDMLNALFTRFDGLAEQHGLEKIKTLGDCYFVCAGVPSPQQNHAALLVAMGLDMVDQLAQFRAETQLAVNVRVGIHSGQVLAGVIGVHRFHYDVWSDDVNIAAHMEASGQPGRVHVSAATASLLGTAYALDPAPPEAGMPTYFVSRHRPEPAHGPLPDGGNGGLGAMLCMRRSLGLANDSRTLLGLDAPVASSDGSLGRLARHHTMAAGGAPARSLHSVATVSSTLRQPPPAPLLSHCLPATGQGLDPKPPLDDWAAACPPVAVGAAEAGASRQASLHSLSVETSMLGDEAVDELLRCKYAETAEAMGRAIRPLVLVFADTDSEVHYQAMYVAKPRAKTLVNTLLAYVCCLLLLAARALALPPDSGLVPQLVGFTVGFAVVALLSCGLGLVGGRFWLLAPLLHWRVSRQFALSAAFLHCCALALLAMLAAAAMLALRTCGQGCMGRDYVALLVLLAMLNTTNFARLRSVFLSALAAVMATLYLALAPWNLGVGAGDVLWLGVGLVVVVAVNWDMEYNVRTHYLLLSALQRDVETLGQLRDHSDHLLANILPAHIADRLKANPGATLAESYPQAAIIFCKIVNFQDFYSEERGLDCMAVLNEIVCEWDELLAKPKYQAVEKIKTIGSTYMAAAGLRTQPSQADLRADTAALADFVGDMFRVLQRVNTDCFTNFDLRVGLNVGPVVGGVIGHKKFAFDIWGDAVNVASRMESSGEAGRIQMTEEARLLLQDSFWVEQRGTIEVKGKVRVRVPGRCLPCVHSQGGAGAHDHVFPGPTAGPAGPPAVLQAAPRPSCGLQQGPGPHPHPRGRAPQPTVTCYLTIRE